MFVSFGQQGFYKELVKDWMTNFNHFRKAPQEKRISMLYLLNEILRQSQNGNTQQFVEQFKDTIEKITKEIIDNSETNSKLRQEFSRVL